MYTKTRRSHTFTWLHVFSYFFRFFFIFSFFSIFFQFFFSFNYFLAFNSFLTIFLTIFFLVHFFLSTTGDEILVVNGKSLQGMKHDEAINVFKSIKTGDVVILIGRRLPKNRKTNDSIETTSTVTTAVLTKNA